MEANQQAETHHKEQPKGDAHLTIDQPRVGMSRNRLTDRRANWKVPDAVIESGSQVTLAANQVKDCGAGMDKD